MNKELALTIATQKAMQDRFKASKESVEQVQALLFILDMDIRNKETANALPHEVLTTLVSAVEYNLEALTHNLDTFKAHHALVTNGAAISKSLRAATLSPAKESITKKTNGVITPDQFRKSLIDRNITHKEWAESRGYDAEYCSRVLTGMVKGVRGKGHEIKVAMGLKVDPKANNVDQSNEVAE